MSENNSQIYKNRCYKCNRKLGLYGIECRCKYIFCNMHIYYNEHNCNFNYKSYEKNRLELSNKKIETIKLEKI